MKTPAYLAFVCLLALAIVVSLAGMMRVSDPARRQPASTLGISTGEHDAWDEIFTEAPPLSAGTAIRIAKTYVARVPLPDYTDDWALDGVTLQRMPSVSARKEWIYLVHFVSVPGFDGTAADRVPLHIPVRFDGTVPPGIVKQIP